MSPRAIAAQGIREPGVRHVVTRGETSWHGFAEAIFELAEAAGVIAHRPRVVPITTAEYPTRAQRPAYSVLDASRLQRDYALVLPEWREALEITLAEATSS